jgi:prepilin-type processing-associated H-X9-DG protein
MTESGERLSNETRLADLDTSSILFADAVPGAWHVGNVLEHAGETFDPANGSEANVNLRFSYGGKANFVRVDGSVFSSERIPPRGNWVIDR